jgi:hypothetical protein
MECLIQNHLILKSMPLVDVVLTGMEVIPMLLVRLVTGQGFKPSAITI